MLPKIITSISTMPIQALFNKQMSDRKTWFPTTVWVQNIRMNNMPKSGHTNWMIFTLFNQLNQYKTKPSPVQREGGPEALFALFLTNEFEFLCLKTG